MYAPNQTDYSIEGARNEDLERRIASLEVSQDADSAGGGSGIPEIDTDFAPLFIRNKNNCQVTLGVFILDDTEELRFILLDDTMVVDEDTYESTAIRTENETPIEDSHRTASPPRIETVLKQRLRYTRTYHVKRLIAIALNGLKTQNPSTTPLFAEYDGNVLLTFTTPDKFGVPSAPADILIISNALNPDTEGFDAKVVFRVYAPLGDLGELQTYEQADVDWVSVVVRRQVSGAKNKPFIRVLDDEEITQVDNDPPDGLGAASPFFGRGFVDIEGNVDAAQEYRWLKNVAFTNGTRKVATPASPVTFFGGGLKPGTDGLPEITDFSFIGTVTLAPASSRSLHLEADWRQANPAIGLRGVRLAIKRQSQPDSAYKGLKDTDTTLRDDRFHQPGLLVSDPLSNGGPITWDIPVKPGHDYTIRLNLVSRTGINRFVTVNVDATILNEPSSPNAALITVNELEPKTKKHDARLVFRIHAPLTSGGAAQTWAAALVEKVWVQLRRNGATQAKKYGGALNATELTQVDAGSTPANRGFIDIEVALKVDRYDWVQNIIEGNSEVEQSSGAAVAFNAGGLAIATAGIPELSGVSLSINTSAPYSGTKGMLSLLITQPATAVALRNAKIERNIGAGNVQVGDLIPIDDDDWHTPGAKTIPLREMSLKKLATNNITVTIKAQGGATRTVTLSPSTGDENVGDDAVPSGLATPLVDLTSEGRLRIRGLLATTNIGSLKNKHIVIYDGTNTGSTKYLDIAARAAITGSGLEASARFSIGLKNKETFAEIKKKIYKTVFGPTGTFFVYWYAENAIGVSLKSPDSAGLAIANWNEFIGDNSDGVSLLDVSAPMGGNPAQIMENGDFLYSTTPGGTEVLAWQRRASPFTAGTTLDTGTGDSIFWDKDNHCIVWQNQNNRLYGRLKKRIVPGEVLTITFMAKTDGSFGVDPIVFLRFRRPDNTDDTVLAAEVTLEDITTSYQMYGGTIELIDTSDPTENKFLSFESSSTLTNPNNIIIDKVMVVRGRQPATYSPRALFEQNGSSTVSLNEDPDVDPNPVPVPDIGAGSGAAGGFPGTGRFEVNF